MSGSAQQIIPGLWLGCQRYESGPFQRLEDQNIRLVVQAGTVLDALYKISFEIYVHQSLRVMSHALILHVATIQGPTMACTHIDSVRYCSLPVDDSDRTDILGAVRDGNVLEAIHTTLADGDQSIHARTCAYAMHSQSDKSLIAEVHYYPADLTETRLRRRPWSSCPLSNGNE